MSVLQGIGSSFQRLGTGVARYQCNACNKSFNFKDQVTVDSRHDSMFLHFIASEL